MAVEERGSPGTGACLLKCTVVHMPPSLLQLVVLPVASTASARVALLGKDCVLSQEFLWKPVVQHIDSLVWCNSSEAPRVHFLMFLEYIFCDQLQSLPFGEAENEPLSIPYFP